MIGFRSSRCAGRQRTGEEQTQSARTVRGDGAQRSRSSPTIRQNHRRSIGYGNSTESDIEKGGRMVQGRTSCLGWTGSHYSNSHLVHSHLDILRLFQRMELGQIAIGCLEESRSMPTCFRKCNSIVYDIIIYQEFLWEEKGLDETRDKRLKR